VALRACWFRAAKPLVQNPNRRGVKSPDTQLASLESVMTFAPNAMAEDSGKVVDRDKADPSRESCHTNASATPGG
jgi:hypothetical protein